MEKRTILTISEKMRSKNFQMLIKTLLKYFSKKFAKDIKRKSVVACTDASINMKCVLQLKYVGLEDALLQWIKLSNSFNFPISDD